MGPAKRNEKPGARAAASQTDRPRAEQCPWCSAPVLRALVGSVAAFQVRADPFPLTLRQELEARLQGRTTYCLRLHRLLPPRLIRRSPEHIRAGRCTHLVIADHNCTRTPASVEPRTAPDNRLF